MTAELTAACCRTRDAGWLTAPGDLRDPAFCQDVIGRLCSRCGD
jgi:hypothetical protein